ncbi:MULTISPECIES: cupin domain-containing protein [unclassified Thermotoga]|uniref:cupin domain-containing protein n=1 Tax=unclassified Thermotoga TaxID=2631113 RepID=UPI0005412F48|nr:MULTISPECIES: cupin domain-containing protein [unclassified Thermotoga]AIY89026.1 Cupin 2 conserved barrel domain protein [Thermotoga sp. Cell2]KHC93195.1 Cupin 2 conserved barrel domain protein [Thermotoga sp. TBGT1765]KHC94603.1 Cupin 2 conserved barrel domain protein [Thermotoga sp. TBGT1766]KHC95954.1 Cupin 2 conserved barrel domain protein [Thermotoga sp. Xyl54]
MVDDIFERGSKGSSDFFTGNVWVKMLVTDENGVFDTQVYNVVFEPGARTHWHSHPGGQILIVTRGKGFYQERGKPVRILKKGDVVEIPPNVVHWHGAAPDEELVHIGISTQVHLGPAEWFGPVTEEEYRKATEGK